MVFWHGEQEIQKMVFSMENRRSRRKTGVASPRIEHTSSDIA